MKRAWMAAVAIGVLMAGGAGSLWGDGTSQNPGEYVDSVASDIKTRAAEEFKKAFSNEVTAFFRSDDLAKTLGVDSDGQAKLEESIKSYIEQYSMDEEKLGRAKESLNTLLENAQGLSAEELQDRIGEIFGE